jgi:hypothetical protein
MDFLLALEEWVSFAPEGMASPLVLISRTPALPAFIISSLQDTDETRNISVSENRQLYREDLQMHCCGKHCSGHA